MIPEKIILEMATYIAELEQRLNNNTTVTHYNCLTAEPNVSFNSELIQLVLDSVATERDAEYELAYAAMEMFQNSVGSNYEEDLRDVANALVSFGNNILRELKRYGLYQHGTLPYQFQGWIGRDLILGLNQEKQEDEDTRHARMYSSRYEPDPGI